VGCRCVCVGCRGVCEVGVGWCRVGCVEGYVGGRVEGRVGSWSFCFFNVEKIQLGKIRLDLRRCSEMGMEVGFVGKKENKKDMMYE